MTTIREKKEYVRSTPNIDNPNHMCHWPGCQKIVPPALWGCRMHWFRLPPAIRTRIWKTYRPGQEISKTPSDEYIEAVKAALEWIAKRTHT